MRPILLKELALGLGLEEAQREAATCLRSLSQYCRGKPSPGDLLTTPALYSSVPLLSRYLVSVYRGPDTGLDARDTDMSEIVISPVLRNCIIKGRETAGKVNQQVSNMTESYMKHCKGDKQGEVLMAGPYHRGQAEPL